MRARALILSLAVLCPLGCQSASPLSGVTARLRVVSGQYVVGAMPAAQNGPTVQSLTAGSFLIPAGLKQKTVSGLLSSNANAVAFALDGDRGYWVLPAGVPDAQSMDLYTFQAELAFSPALAPGPQTLIVRAVDQAGHFGPPVTEGLTIEPAMGIPTGALVVSLFWDTESDLDLHVVDPTGNEIWARNRTASAATTADGAPAGAYLDFDSNAQCLIDGLRQEDVIWTTAPPAGHYIARVDAFSLCQASFANWRVEVRRAGELIAQSAGEALSDDTRGNHDRGAGRTAAEFDLP